MIDVERIRRDFPGLDQRIGKSPLVYLDNAASSQTAQPVLDAIMRGYIVDRANIHRGVHELSQRATVAYEDARVAMSDFLRAQSPSEIVFVRGTTEAINLVAFGLAERVREGDEIAISEAEHHSNWVPWEMLARRKNARLVVVPVDDNGIISVDAARRLLTRRTRVASFGHVSNALGVVQPIRELIAAAHDVGALAVVDGAQAVPHFSVDVAALDADFYAFSGHKLYGPTGIGVLYGKKTLLDEMPPWQGGGDMIEHVTKEGTTFAQAPARFEAGTPNIVGARGLAAATRYLESHDRVDIEAHERRLYERAVTGLQQLRGIRILGDVQNKVAVLSFVVDGVHSQDIGVLLDKMGVAVRTGHHCAEPLMQRLGVTGTTRASFAFYNTDAEVDAFVRAISKATSMLRDDGGAA